ncbi:hypothetical protein [Desemzia sp. FAM 23990]|uniref:hypothetical protein n=1 Tax=Desemzia sp. FAM 23990 TaxID=3259520 RepID=UPI00388A329D
MSKLFYFLIRNRKNKNIGKICTALLKIIGVEIPQQVIVGDNIMFPHLGGNIVIHPETIIKNHVSIYHGVTIGRADSYIVREKSKMEKIIIEDGTVVCAGAKILCKSGVLTVGERTVIGANAVLTKSTGVNEIWASPAVKIGNR